jgi:purine-cytosine permease-like protein
VLKQRIIDKPRKTFVVREMQETDDSSLPGAEYQREPVPASAQLGFTSFLGMYAGEHTAGTELMIGPLFIAAGVGAVDLIFGLLLGNLLAVLSWVCFTAPIATRARLTLYYQLEKISGRQLVVIYNFVNGMMFCLLAASMITVAATSVGVVVNISMPQLDDVYPNSLGWVLAVVSVGALITWVAVYGYNTIAKFANIAAPWMVIVFLAFGVISLRQLVTASGATIDSWSDLWQFANSHIWRGGEPLAGRTKFTFWHVVFFAWFCNIAMHMGMSDLTVLRFARKSWYGFATASGMFLGHFVAWIAASIMYAHQLFETPSNTEVLPGPMTYKIYGIAGVLCVIIAGWTTANPTIYRAGLAFQSIVPSASTFRVTVFAGALATIGGMFPAIAMKFLEFIALYGLLLMPMGAVIFADFWLSDKLGFADKYAERTGSTFNPAAGAAWLLTLLLCLSAVALGGMQIYFVSLPGWFMAAMIYIVGSKLLQRTAVIPKLELTAGVPPR